MASALLACFAVLQGPFCAKSQRRGSEARYVDADCVFCRAFTTNRSAFDIVWEDADFVAFRDRKPACVHHIQLIPKWHIRSVRELTTQDADMVGRMSNIGNAILDQFHIPHMCRKMGFHIPPFNSVPHLHLHVQALPYTPHAVRLKYPVARGFGSFDKGLSWFVEVGQAVRILDKGSSVGILPC